MTVRTLNGCDWRIVRGSGDRQQGLWAGLGLSAAAAAGGGLLVVWQTGELFAQAWLWGGVCDSLCKCGCSNFL